MRNVGVKDLRARVLLAIDMLQREARGQPWYVQPPRCLDYTPYGGLRVIAAPGHA